MKTRCRACAPFVVVLLALMGGAACVSKAGLVSSTYTIDPPAGSGAAAPSGSGTLALRRVYVAAVYSGSSLVYRLGEHRVELDPYAYWAASPGQMLTSAVTGYLRQSGLVSDVVVDGAGVPVLALVEPSVSELYGDLAEGSPAAAVLTMQLRVLSVPKGAVLNRELMLRRYTRRMPISQRTAAAVVAALNEALADIMKEFVGDLKSALPPR